MKNFKKLVFAFAKDESGQDLIEYALVAGLIGLGAVVAMGTLNDAIGDAFDNVAAKLTTNV